MKNLYLILVTCLLALFGCTSIQNNDTKPLLTVAPSFEQQLETFRQLGFVLNPGIDTSDINRWPDGHSEFEKNPYQLMYQTLGQTIERDPFTPLTDKVWNIDMKSIEGHDSYVEIMKNLSRITGNELVFENLEDHFDTDGNKSRVSFTCRGDDYKWDLKMNGDWVDPDIFDKVQSLTEKYKTTGKFTLLKTGGQDIVIGYSTDGELEKLKKATKLDITWLTAKWQTKLQ